MRAQIACSVAETRLGLRSRENRMKPVAVGWWTFGRACGSLDDAHVAGVSQSQDSNEDDGCRGRRGADTAVDPTHYGAARADSDPAAVIQAPQLLTPFERTEAAVSTLA